MAEITPEGYDLKTQNEWFDQERALYLSIDPNWNLDPSTPDGLKLASDAEIFSAFDETLQQAYNSKDPAKAVGADLDIIGDLTGSKRSAGSSSDVQLVLTGTPSFPIPAGTTFESITTGSRWITNQSYTLDVSGQATVSASCIDIGPTMADPNTITRIVTTVSGLTGVNNPAAATPGTLSESNASYRVKRAQSVGRPGNNQVDSMYGELFAVPEIRHVAIYENDTNSASVSADNPYGLPAHSLSVIADGGTDDDVALAIYLKKNPGVYLNAANAPVEVLVTSPTYPTNRKLIRFSRPDYVDVVIDVEITNDGTLPANIIDLVKDAYIDFSSGNLTSPSCGFKALGFAIGEDVPYSTMFTPVNKVIGSYGNSYVSSLEINSGTTNLAIDFNELSRWTDANINVTIVP